MDYVYDELISAGKTPLSNITKYEIQLAVNQFKENGKPSTLSPKIIKNPKETKILKDFEKAANALLTQIRENKISKSLIRKSKTFQSLLKVVGKKEELEVSTPTRGQFKGSRKRTNQSNKVVQQQSLLSNEATSSRWKFKDRPNLTEMEVSDEEASQNERSLDNLFEEDLPQDEVHNSLEASNEQAEIIFNEQAEIISNEQVDKTSPTDADAHNPIFNDLDEPVGPPVAPM